MVFLILFLWFLGSMFTRWNDGKHLSQTRLHFATRLFFYVATFCICTAAVVCPENQTAELGGQGYIRCNFPDVFRSVYWFDNTSDRSPVIRFKTDSGVRSGPGFDSGEYYIHQNGSLVILNVTAWHEKEYRAIVYTDITFETILVSLKVIATPGVDCVPVVKCHNCYQEYYYHLIDTDTLTCSFSAARPPVQLTWFEHSGDRYEQVEIQQPNITGNSNGTYNSLTTLNLTKGSSNFIHLLKCRSTWSQSDWSRDKQILVDLSKDKSFSNNLPKPQYMEVNKQSKIHCGQLASIYVVWKRIPPNSEPEIIGFHSQAMTETMSSSPDVEVSAEGSMIFSSPQVHHERIYACIYGNGQKEDIQMTSVRLLIPPSPPYIQITGCTDVSHRCVIRENSTKELTCAVHGVRPSVTLDWIADDGDKISFFDRTIIHNKRGETTDTILSVGYKVSQDVLCGEEIVIKCHLYGPISNVMKAETTVFIKPASCRENEVKGEHGLHGSVIALVVCYGLLLIVIVCFIICCICCKHMTFLNGGNQGDQRANETMTFLNGGNQGDQRANETMTFLNSGNQGDQRANETMTFSNGGNQGDQRANETMTFLNGGNQGDQRANETMTFSNGGNQGDQRANETMTFSNGGNQGDQRANETMTFSNGGNQGDQRANETMTFSNGGNQGDQRANETSKQ